MSDGFFQECIEAEQGSILIAAIESGEVDIESRDCDDRTTYGRFGLQKTSVGQRASSLGYKSKQQF